MNANCYLERGSEFAQAAKAHGVDYESLIGRIVDLAAERWQHRGPQKAEAKARRAAGR